MSQQPSSRALLLASGIAGLASGGRSTLGPAVTRLSSKHSARSRGLVLAGIASELVVDKLPQTPSRLRLAPLAGRVAAGGLAGFQIARLGKAPVVASTVAGAAAALAGSYAGNAWRQAWARTGKPDLPAALAEDAASIGLAYAASRVVSPS
ncbi:hypothetical protein KV097_15140 [Mumia sp. zg.B17]|uniref:hypothetical protein n=1 Tax=Mumia sp. zg.B17 TaxID=2855446 RepID=UPI001C6E8070|nr:hypothetical protein [Mumia sp. zg.B17]MBW9207276.1 hypothetical protein [Mumia sp. zg.B17]